MLALIERAIPDHQRARGELSRRVGTALTRLQLALTGPAHVDMLRTPGGWRVEISQPAPLDRAKGQHGTRAGVPAATLGNIHRVRHGSQILELVEVAAFDE